MSRYCLPQPEYLRRIVVTALHESAHVVVAVHFSWPIHDRVDIVRKTVVMPDGRVNVNLGAVRFHKGNAESKKRVDWSSPLLRTVSRRGGVICLAPAAFLQAAYGTRIMQCAGGFDGDYEHVRLLAGRLYADPDRQREWVDARFADAWVLFRDVRLFNAVVRLADTLLYRREIAGPEAGRMVRGYGIPIVSPP
jgi:hypothetical protein